MRILFCLLSAMIFALPVNASQKVALVIGNTDYLENYDLANPVNDATDVAAALTKHGFDVTTRFDLTRENMVTSLQGFRKAADTADIALVYYSGHGMEFDGENYLIPVDAKLTDSRDIPDTTVPLSAVLRQISGAARLKMVVLDACRNNPFAANMLSPSGKKFVSQGLSTPTWKGDNTLIAYAAAAGAVTPDGEEGGNSPYTSAFLEALDGPPRDVGLFMRVVGAGMRERTGSSSLPFVYSSIPPEELIINSGSEIAKPVTVALPKSEPVVSAPAPTAEQDDPALTRRTFTGKQLAFAVQTELNRLQCGALGVDGVFGAQSRKALARYYQFSKVTPTTNVPTVELLEALEQTETALCPKPVKKVTVRTAAKVRKPAAHDTKVVVKKAPAAPQDTRPDPVRYSYVVWPARSVPYNAKVSKNTTYGRLTCRGGRGTSIPRKCSWN